MSLTQNKNYSTLNNFKFIKQYIVLKKSDYFLTLLLLFFKSIPFFSIPLLIKLIIDSYIPTGDKKSIIFALLIGIFLAFSNIIFHTAYVPASIKIVRNSIKNIQLGLIKKFQQLPQSYFDITPNGIILSRLLVSTKKILEFVRFFFIQATEQILVTVFSLIILTYIDIQLTLLLLLFIPVFLLLNIFFKPRMQQVQKEERIVTEGLVQAVSTFLQTAELSRIHGEEFYENQKIDAEGHKVVDANRRVIGQAALIQSSFTVIHQILLLNIIGILAVYVIKRRILIGEMIIFTQYLTHVFNFITSLANEYALVASFNESVVAIKKVLEHPIPHRGEDIIVNNIEGDVHFNNISFTYPNTTKKVLSNITISVSKGETIALVGNSGSGKSTFVKLLMGLYEPDSGEIFIDNYKLKDLEITAFRKNIGVVTQDPLLFNMTVYENIIHGNSQSTPNEVLTTLKLANAYDFVHALPDKLDTVISEGGANFSGGQKQRLCIARALHRKPSILILDEATSALDSESEQLVQKSIDSLLGSQTTFIVAHRLSTIFHATKILVFKEGEIYESGTHNELIDKQGEYAALLSTQVKIPIEKLYALKN